MLYSSNAVATHLNLPVANAAFRSTYCLSSAVPFPNTTPPPPPFRSCFFLSCPTAAISRCETATPPSAVVSCSSTCAAATPPSPVVIIRALARLSRPVASSARLRCSRAVGRTGDGAEMCVRSCIVWPKMSFGPNTANTARRRNHHLGGQGAALHLAANAAVRRFQRLAQGTQSLTGGVGWGGF